MKVPLIYYIKNQHLNLTEPKLKKPILIVTELTFNISLILKLNIVF